jgi:threonine dehydrogenase-like Zn-dependent dehydrogenase
LLGAGRVIAIDQVAERLEMARAEGKAETIDFSEAHVLEQLREMTAGRGPDACIDAVGLEAHGHSIDALYDRARAATRVLATDRPHVLREAIMACRKGGTVSIPGVYGGLLDKIPMGAAFAKGLTFKMGQTHVHRYMKPLLQRIEKGEIDPSFLITHRAGLEDAPDAYAQFAEHREGYVKVVLKPSGVNGHGTD